MNLADTNYPEILIDLHDNLVELFVAAGAEPEKAKSIAFAASENIRKKWGGLAVYIGKGVEFELTARDYEIYRRFDGTNKHLLCREHDISEQRLYQIVAKVRADEIAKRQLRLFE